MEIFKILLYIPLLVLRLLWYTLWYTPEEREFLSTGKVTDVQKYVAVYKKELDGPFWGHLFVKSKKEAMERIRSKIGKGAVVSIIWLCEWRKPEAELELVYGKNEGKFVAESLIKEIRGNAGIEKKDRPVVIDLPKRKVVAEDLPKPRIKLKKAKKETEAYSPPYTIRIAGDKK